MVSVSEANRVYSERLAGLEAWLREEMDRWQVPGLGLGIIANGEVIFADGFGYRDAAKALPVDTDTLFAIGSCSKAFTTFDMGLLVDEGRLDWDTPLREYLPDFRLADPVATELATPRDLVSHRVGLPRHDFVWYGAAASRRELYHALRYLTPSKTFRQAFQYQNLMYMTAGVLVEQISGQRWEDFTRERIFAPLGMTSSQFSVSDSETSENAALPYDWENGKSTLIPFRNIDAIGPAGSINASIREMLYWLQMQMSGGRHNGAALIAEATLREMHTPQVVMPITPDMPWYGHSEVTHTGYGLGWATQVYRGRTMIRHTGGIDGFISSVSFFPEVGLGAVLLTNTGNTFAPTAIALRLFDTLLGLEPVAWSDRLNAHLAQLKTQAENSKAEVLKQRKDNAPAAHPLADYAGTYRHPAYGSIDLTSDGAHLSTVYHTLKLTLAHHHYETFTLTGEGVDLFTLASFTTDAAGQVSGLSLTLEPAVAPMTFQRVAQAG